MKKTTIVMLACLFVVGCGERLPEGMPKLYPARLTLTQAGKPVPGATVLLQSHDPASRYSYGGATDERGTVQFMSHGKYPGVPEGTYTVTVSKTETVRTGPWDEIPEGESESRAWIQKNKDRLKTETFSIVDPKLERADTSDLEITVTPKGYGETIDIPEYRRQMTDTELN